MEELRMALPWTVRTFARAIVMPSLDAPVTSAAHRDRMADQETDVLDREKALIDRVLVRPRADLPALRIGLQHVTVAEREFSDPRNHGAVTLAIVCRHRGRVDAG